MGCIKFSVLWDKVLYVCCVDISVQATSLLAIPLNIVYSLEENV